MKRLIGFSFQGNQKLLDAEATAAASKSTNGTGYSPTIPTTTAKGSSWIGSCFLRAVSAAAHHSERAA